MSYYLIMNIRRRLDLMPQRPSPAWERVTARLARPVHAPGNSQPVPLRGADWLTSGIRSALRHAAVLQGLRNRLAWHGQSLASL